MPLPDYATFQAERQQAQGDIQSKLTQLNSLVGNSGYQYVQDPTNPYNYIQVPTTNSLGQTTNNSTTDSNGNVIGGSGTTSSATAPVNSQDIADTLKAASPPAESTGTQIGQAIGSVLPKEVGKGTPQDRMVEPSWLQSTSNFLKDVWKGL